MAGFRLGTRKQRSWDVARGRFDRALKSIEKRQQLAIRRAALLAEREIKLGLSKGSPGGKSFKPLSPITLLTRRKRSSKPLLDSGALRGSIKTTFSTKKNEAFVGVHRTAKAPDQKDVVNIAAVHEFGTGPYVIPVTPAMRRFFLFLFRASGGKIRPISPNKRFIVHPGVPKRPFIRPVIEKLGPQLEKELRLAFESGGGLL